MGRNNNIDENEDEGSGGIVSIERAFRILEWLADAEDGLTFAMIREKLNLNQGLCFKLMATLEGTGYVYKREDIGRYFLSYKVNNMAMRRLNRNQLMAQCRGILSDLAQSTGELVRLGIVENNDLIWVLAFPGPKQQSSSLRIEPHQTRTVDLHTHASGKAWLSTLPSTRVEELILARGMPKRTRYSITDLDDLIKDLARAARTGYAASYQEHELGVGAVAAPILVKMLNDAIVCVGVVSLAAPVTRMSDLDLQEAAPRVIATAKQLASIWPLNQDESMALPTARVNS
jgi:IclR family transcriptional regulator, acetate operon repressor